MSTYPDAETAAIPQVGEGPVAAGRARLRGLCHPRLPFAALAFIACTTAGGQESRGQDPGAGLPYWEWSGEGVSLRLVQRLPDQTRAFFLGRGFDADSADLIARNCVLQTIFRNTAEGPEARGIDFDLGQWRVIQGQRSRSLRLREDWSSTWAGRGVPQAARIAFHWSLLPTRQHFEPGDYNWGMTSYGLAPGERFDLELVWHREGRSLHGRLHDIQCAPDIHPSGP